MMRTQTLFQRIRIGLFSALLILGCIGGFLLFLRPTTSDTEGRELTKFPAFTVEGFLSGAYTSQISLWYADTFPFRDRLLEWNSCLKESYGIGDHDFHGYGGSVDSLDFADSLDWNNPPVNPFPSEPDIGKAEPPPAAEAVDGYYIKGDTCWQLYYYKKDLVDRYCRAVVKTAQELHGIATVYDMVVPTSCCYGLSSEELAALGASDGLAVMDHIYTAIDVYCPQAGVTPPVVTLPVHDMLGEHYSEYIYFRTDHHWTSLGAWYASRYFLDAVGRAYPPLGAYEVFTYEHFLGSMYRHTQNEGLKNSPDTLVAYLSPTVSELLTESKGIYRTQPLIHKEITSSNKYLCFCAGDHAYYEVHNETISDGSSILIIKESYGNAFIPMLVDSYEYVYAIDYRFWQGDLVAFATERGIDTVLFLNNLMATADSYTVTSLERLVG